MNIRDRRTQYRIHKKVFRKSEHPKPFFVRIVVRLYEIPPVHMVAELCEHTFFRPVALLIAASITFGVTLFAILLANFFGYTIISFDGIIPVFALGYMIGLLKEYIHFMLKQHAGI